MQNNRSKTKILVMDIETSPSLGAYFQLYREGNIVWTERDWYVMSWVAKWEGSNTIIARSLPDYTNYKKNPEDDSALLKDLHKLVDLADIVVAHNGKSFDVKKINARFIINGLKPPTPYKVVDTKLVAKKYFGFESNKLTDLGRYFGLGEKMDTGGIDLWRDCLRGDLKAWRKMVRYNIQDVVLLEKIYLHMRPWMTDHPNMNLTNETNCNCPNCGSNDLQRRGFALTRTTKYQRLQCKNCGAWSTGSKEKIDHVIR